jgi:hypothetical protein
MIIRRSVLVTLVFRRLLGVTTLRDTPERQWNFVDANVRFRKPLDFRD